MTEQQYKQLNGVGKEQAMLAQIILDQHPADKEIQHNEQRNNPDIQTISLPETRISISKRKEICRYYGASRERQGNLSVF